MVRVIKYINNKSYIQDTKIGRRWKVPEKRERKADKRGGRRKKMRKEGGQKPSGLSTKRRRRFRPGTVAL